MTKDSVDQEFEAEVREHGGVKMHVVYVNTSAVAEFSVPRTTTLDEAFNKAYAELKEKRRPTDTFFCEDGAPLQQYLSLTLEELHRRKICRKRRFQISGETGGA